MSAMCKTQSVLICGDVCSLSEWCKLALAAHAELVSHDSSVIRGRGNGGYSSMSVIRGKGMVGTVA